MELVAAVADPLPVRPTDRHELRGGERLGDQHIVVDGQDERAQSRQQGPIRVGGERHPPRHQLAVCAAKGHPLARVLDAGDRGSLVDADAGFKAQSAQPPRQPGRVQQGRPPVNPQSALVRGRPHLGTHLAGVERVLVVAVRPHRRRRH
jgi:hypothetical protein